MADDYVRTETMRIKISGDPLSGEFSVLDLIGTESPAYAQAGKTYARDFTDLLESVYDAVLITEVNGMVIKFNGRAVEYFGYERENFYRLNILNLICEADNQTLKTIYQALVNKRRIFIEGLCRRRDGSVFPAEITASILHLFDPEQLCFFIRNVSVQAEAQEALRQAQQELVEVAHHAGMAEIATGVLHDVGNLLNSINVSCELILQALDHSALNSMHKINDLLRAQENVLEYITKDPHGQKLPQLYLQLGAVLTAEQDQLRQEAANLRDKIQMIKEVISTQQTYAKAGLYEEEVRIENLVEDSLGILTNSIESDKLNIEKNYAQTPPVRLQKSKFVHVLLNIIKNARDALINVTDQPRTIGIETYREGHFVSVKVSDNGAGIAQEDLDKIFTHGFTTKDSGHGFGLHSCANLMSEMGGRIQVKSDGPGQGASFILTLPAAAKA